jgi:MbtH protein
VAGNTPEEFVVVVNGEEQYSIWPGAKSIPRGWRAVGVGGGKQECVDYVNSVWTDMRPKSLREFMDSSAD